MLFTPKIEIIGNVNGSYSVDRLSEETSVYAASPNFVRQHCGPIANDILDAVNPSYYTLCEELGMLPNIDIRVHRLNIGEYPAIPGWHCDGVKRETYHGQPNPDQICIRDTVLCVVSMGSISNPEIITEQLEIDVINQGDDFKFWQYVDSKIPHNVGRIEMPDGQITMIGESTLHRVMPAKERGFRLFFRMSMWHNNYVGDEGKIAKQQQVYLLQGENGW
jgi:hypothetical protein